MRWEETNIRISKHQIYIMHLQIAFRLQLKVIIMELVN